MHVSQSMSYISTIVDELPCIVLSLVSPNNTTREASLPPHGRNISFALADVFLPVTISVIYVLPAINDYSIVITSSI